MSKMFAAVNSVTKQRIFVKQGEVGSWPMEPKDKNAST
jgi:hypothetical protein